MQNHPVIPKTKETKDQGRYLSRSPALGRCPRFRQLSRDALVGLTVILILLQMETAESFLHRDQCGFNRMQRNRLGRYFPGNL